MKPLPTIIASPARATAFSIEKFEGAYGVQNRDVLAYCFRVRTTPDSDWTRIAVWFSGTVLSVRPQAFGLPPAPDRDSAMRVFAEAAIGDYLDEGGFPEAIGDDQPATRIDCFSPRFQDWRDRPAAADDAVEHYLIAHVTAAWKHAQMSWRFASSDLLRLGMPLTRAMRIVDLYRDEAWALKDATQIGVTLTPTPSFLRSQQVTRRKAAPAAAPETPVPPLESSPAEYVYVDEARIAALRHVDAQEFDLAKLIAVCEELNQCYRAQCYHAVAALTRATMDHVPPIFGQRTFSEVGNNYAGTRSFKDVMQRLDASARKIADSHLHTQIRAAESLPTRVQVNFSNELDVLLAEVLRILQPKIPGEGQ